MAINGVVVLMDETVRRVQWALQEPGCSHVDAEAPGWERSAGIEGTVERGFGLGRRTSERREAPPTQSPKGDPSGRQ